MAPPADPDRATAELIVAVPDCRAAHAELAARAAEFLADPVEYPWEIQAFFRDPDGHLFEISQRKVEGALTRERRTRPAHAVSCSRIRRISNHAAIRNGLRGDLRPGPLASPGGRMTQPAAT